MTTIAQKLATKRWRDNNREAYNNYQLTLSNKYYKDNTDKILEYKRKKYVFEKQCKLFRNILLE